MGLERGGGAVVAVDAPAEVAGSPILAVLALRNYRYFWIAQFLTALVAGVLRFAFIWLALDLSDASAAEGLMGLSLGLPLLFLSLPAGVWSDRIDRRWLVLTVNLGAAAILALTAVLIWTDVITLWLAMLMALGSGAVQAATMPALQAMVPQLVPRERLMTGVALQNIGMQVSQLTGAAVGGGSIALMGTGNSFALWAGLMVLSSLMMWPVRLTPIAGQVEAASRSMLASVLGGLRFAFGHEPVRSLMFASLMMGVGGGAFGVLLPAIGRNQLDQGPFQTALLSAALGIGMISSSLVLASRSYVRRKGVLFIGALFMFGPGLMVIGLSQVYLATFGFMIFWGVMGGILVTSQRTLLQEHTPDEMMGRVMSLMALSMGGTLPLAALAIVVLRQFFSEGETMALIGVAMIGVALVIARRRELRAA